MENAEAGPSITKVRWAFDVQNAGQQSFASDSSATSTPEGTTSTLAFVNSQLVAHGFVRSPGLQLQTLDPKDQEIAAKCLMGMLGQRMDDISRSEDVTTKLRTLTYDHERLTSLHKTAVEKMANAEREAELAKSKMNAAAKSLATEQSAHKQTSATLSKTKSALEYAKSTAQNEIKRKEKDVEKIWERWAKISNEQARLGSIGTGMDCPNLAIVEGGRGPLEDPLVEQALADLEATKSRLLEENDAFRDVVLSAARSLQSLVYELDSSVTEPPPLLTANQLFSPASAGASSLYDAAAHALNAHMKLKEIIVSVRSKVESVCAQAAEKVAIKDAEKKLEQEILEKKGALKELDRAKASVDELKEELARAASAAQKNGDDERQALTAMITRDIEEITKRLAVQEDELQQERDQIAEAATQLGQEKADLELERQQLLEEKRAWQAQRMLTEPDTPESRREKEIEEALARDSKPSDGNAGMQKGTGRLHQVRRGRSSFGLPTSNAVQHSRQSTTPVGPDSPDNNSKATNPFEEVLLRSAQRPMPVFSDGSSLPSFQKANALDVEPQLVPTSSNAQDNSSPVDIPAEVSSNAFKAFFPPKHRSPMKARHPRTGEPVTPPIFTHRRVVGKKHQYSPAVPSPLSKFVKMAESSGSDMSPEDVANQTSSDVDPNSLSPTNGVMAAIVASGGRFNGGPTSTRFSFKPAASLALDVAVGEEKDEAEEWVDEAPPSPVEVSPPLIPRNTEPLREDDLIIAPRPKPGSSKAPPIRKTVGKPPSAVATKARIPPAAPTPALAKGKEKENVPTKVVRIASPQGKAKPMSGKVMIGKSATTKSTLASKLTKPTEIPAKRAVKLVPARPKPPATTTDVGTKPKFK